ncbi:phage tail tube protein, partial [Asticcacaulis sp. AC466]|uniref:phage tail tube protein n=1 Tax=Asticcacaulis sp. AC466 TaxID=1282362 RepID=UPI0004CF17FA
MAVNQTKQHTYGSGEVYFARFKSGTQIPEARRYLGNTTNLSFSTAIEKLEHFDSDHGVKEKDDSITTSTTMTGTTETDNVNQEN